MAGLRVHNCRILNCNQQFIKGSSSENDPLGATDGCIEQCLFEFTSGWAYQSYTGGIDIHKGVNWIVRDNLFRNLRIPAGQAGIAEHAVHFWKRCSTRPQNIVVERNWVVDCDRGIGFGLGNAEGDHQGGASVIRNNMVFNAGAGPRTDVGWGWNMPRMSGWTTTQWSFRSTGQPWSIGSPEARSGVPEQLW